MKELKSILTLLAPHAEIVDGESLGELRALGPDFEQHLASIREQGRNLRIAVIGQMKAGKSSFLNAALFGQDVLPKAETPMTAALSRIVYGNKSYAEVTFYSQDDWAGIEQGALDYELRYQQEEARLADAAADSPFVQALAPTPAEIIKAIDPALTACAELVGKAREHGLDLASYLGQTATIEDAGDASQLANALQDYVGSGGRFTAITKMTTLYLDDKRIEGLEVVDTPGFNDPVVSRGTITRNHLARCDVIFFLSRMGQFLTSADMRVVREQLPEAGLGHKAVFLVGTQLDLALRSDGKLIDKAAEMAGRCPPEQREAATLQAMLQLMGHKMSGVASEAFAGRLADGGVDERGRRLLEELRARPPYFISAWAALTARRLGALSSDDNGHLERLTRQTGIAYDAARLDRLSNIPALFKEITGQRARKQELLAGKENDLVASQRTRVQRCLEQLRTRLAEERRRIEHGTMVELERLEQETVTRLERGKAGLEEVFDEQAVEASKKFALLKTRLRTLSRSVKRVESRTETRSESYQEDVSWFKGLFGHTWETRYRNVEAVYANVQDAVEEIDRFANECVDNFQQAITGCVNLEGLRARVSRAAMALFDTGSADFDGDLVLAGINKSLRRLAIPTVDFGSQVFAERITKQFGSGRVGAGEVESLQQAQRAAVQAVLADIEKLVDRKIADIEASLARSEQTFVADMSRDITAYLRKLRAQRADREAALEQVGAAHKAVERCFALLG